MSGPSLNRKLVLEELSRESDGAGGFLDSWTELGTLWGHIRPGAGREALGGDASLSSAAYTVTVRAAAHGAPSRPRADQRFGLIHAFFASWPSRMMIGSLSI